jgi:hydrogenase maturation protease
MASPTKKLTCIIGIGNPLRGDDGVGQYIAEQIEKKQLAEVTVIITQQLDMGLAEELQHFDRVVFVDASLTTDTFAFSEITGTSASTDNASHRLPAAMLADLTRQLFSTPAKFYLCAIGAVNFEMGASLSATTLGNATAAIAALTGWIQGDD